MVCTSAVKLRHLKNLPLNFAPHVLRNFFDYFMAKIPTSLYLDGTINNVKTAL